MSSHDMENDLNSCYIPIMKTKNMFALLLPSSKHIFMFFWGQVQRKQSPTDLRFSEIC